MRLGPDRAAKLQMVRPGPRTGQKSRVRARPRLEMGYTVRASSRYRSGEAKLGETGWGQNLGPRSSLVLATFFVPQVSEAHQAKVEILVNYSR